MERNNLQSETGETVSLVAAEESEVGTGGGGGGEAASVGEMITVGHGGEVVETIFLRQALNVHEILNGVGISVVNIEAEEPIGRTALNPTHTHNQQNHS